MAVDVGSAVLISGVSTVLGFGASYLIFKKFVADKYAVGRAQENKIFYWMGFVAMLALGQSLGTIVNEILISISLGSQINGDKIFKGLIGAIFFPIVFALFAFLFNKISPSKNKIIKNNSQEDDSTISTIADEYWEKASREFDNERHEATWAKSLASSGGDEAKAKGFYLKFRAIDLQSTDSSSHIKINSASSEASRLSKKHNWFSSLSFYEKIGMIFAICVISTFTYVSLNSKSITKDIGEQKPDVSQYRAPLDVKSSESNKAITTIEEKDPTCYVYWNGKEFVIGKTEGEEFLRYRAEKNKAKSFEMAFTKNFIRKFENLENEQKGQDPRNNKEFEKFFNYYWYQIASLCNISW